jgi:orotidine-5'-phosphate decarboxylase
MESFVSRLISAIREKKSHVVLGLDPVYETLPSALKLDKDPTLANAGRAIRDFNYALIDALHELVPAVKPQIAFYERYGLYGLKAFLETVTYAKEKGLLVIEDAKRNDIGSTAQAYSDGHIGRVTLGLFREAVFDVDAITVNAFLGSDGILPFVQDSANYSKGIFVLVKTSNPSSSELQDVVVHAGNRERKLYEVIAEFVNKWGEGQVDDSGYSSVGAVVGATYPADARILRELMPHAYFLVPGFGFQGAGAADVISCFNRDGYGALIAASRSINYAFQTSARYGESRFAEAAREAVTEMNEQINHELQLRGLLHF